MAKVTYQNMEFDEEELKEIRKENRDNQSSINVFDFNRMVNPLDFDYDRNKTYKAIVTDVPGSGKTTAIFQYMRDKLKMLGTYHAVYSASRIEDVYHMFKKFVAEFGDKHKFSLFTSDKKYLDCGVMVILEEFFVPQDVINCRNLVFSSESTKEDYTKHLIVQAIYRTRARCHSLSGKFITISGNKIRANSIKLYIDDRYGNFIKSLLGEFRLSNCNSIDKQKVRPEHIYLKEFEFPDEFIEEKSITGDDWNDYFVINSKNLASVVSNMKSLDNNRIRKILDNNLIKYEVLNTSSGGRNKFILYKIYPYRIVHRIEK